MTNHVFLRLAVLSKKPFVLYIDAKNDSMYPKLLALVKSRSSLVVGDEGFRGICPIVKQIVTNTTYSTGNSEQV